MQWLMMQVLKLHPWTTCPDPARGAGQTQAAPNLAVKVQSLFQDPGALDFGFNHVTCLNRRWKAVVRLSTWERAQPLLVAPGGLGRAAGLVSTPGFSQGLLPLSVHGITTPLSLGAVSLWD